MDTFSDNRELAEYIANRLAGKNGRITLRIQHPIYQHTKGATMKVKGAGLYIDINPDHPPLDQLKTFYHELAHIYMEHFNGVEGIGELDRLPPGIFDIRAKNYTPADNREELEADAVGNAMFTYSERNYHHYGADLIKNRLAAVLEWIYL